MTGDGDAMLGAMFETAPRGILVADLSGRILRVNRAFARLLACTPAELHGRNIADISIGEDTDAFVRRLLSAQDQDVLTHRQYRRKDGGILKARERSTVRSDATDRPRYVLSRVEATTDPANDPLERLSRRERQVLEFVVSGHTSKEIAVHLDVSAATVDTYRRRLMDKLDVGHLPGLVRLALDLGIPVG